MLDKSSQKYKETFLEKEDFNTAQPNNIFTSQQHTDVRDVSTRCIYFLEIDNRMDGETKFLTYSAASHPGKQFLWWPFKSNEMASNCL